MKELKVGQMTSRELADWFGISYSAYRNKTQSRLEQLTDYCTFVPEYNGVRIIKVFCKVYQGPLNKKDIQLAVEYVKEQQIKQNTEKPLLTGAMMANDMIKRGESSYANIKYESACNKACRSLKKAYGTTGFKYKSPLPEGGPYGLRYWTWAVKDLELHQYAPLTKEELNLFYDILCEEDDSEEGKQAKIELALIEDLYENDEISEKTYKEQKKRLKKPFFEYLDEFFQKTGKILTHCQEYELNTPGAF